MEDSVMRRYFIYSILLLASYFALKDQGKTGDFPLGHLSNPIKIAMVPSVNGSKIADNLTHLVQCLQKKTQLFFKILVPNNYVVVVESIGTQRIDIAFLNSFGYVMAKHKYGAHVGFMMSRRNERNYHGAFFVQRNSPIKSMADLQGKRLAFVDPASTSGGIYPKRLLKISHIVPGQIVYAGKHEVALTMLYQGQVDSAVAFWNTSEEKFDLFRDARDMLTKQFPDIRSKLRVLSLTEPITNDGVVYGGHLPASLLGTIGGPLQACYRENADEMWHVTGADDILAATDKDYDSLEKAILEDPDVAKLSIFNP